MQSSKRLHYDEKVSMRRLKPLYDLVDAGQNKKAISEAEKMLKKHPKLHTANALKALALIRIERLTDAESLIGTLEEMCKNDEIDEPFVQALSHCYKELNRPDRIVDMYTELAKRQPTYEPFARELFFAYARCAHLKEQQRVALHLAKICTTTEPSTYYIWAVLVILIQGLQNKQLGASMLFPLANRMLEKVNDEELLQHQGGFELRLMALETVGKYAEAIALINARSGSMGMRIRHQLYRLHQLSGNYAQLFQLCMDSVDNDPNEWSNWTLLFDTFLHLQDNDGIFLSAIIKKCLFLAENSCGGHHEQIKRHTLLLVKLLLFDQLSAPSSSSPNRHTQRALVKQQFDSPLMLHQEMVRNFHNRPSTFMDLKKFLHLLTADEQRALLQYISTILQPTTTGDHADDDGCCSTSSSSSHCQTTTTTTTVFVPSSVWTFMLAEMISFQCFPPSTLSDQTLKDSVCRLLVQIPRIYNSNDLTVAMLVQMVSSYCWEFFLRTGDYNLLLFLLSFLEVFNRQPQCNSLIPILLCRIYAIFGDISRIKKLEMQMDLKFVQRINFAFLQYFVAENFAHFKQAAYYYESMVNLHKANAREISEGIVAAFRREKYLQIPNLYDFLQTSQNSVYSYYAIVQQRTLSACFGAQSLEMATNLLRMDDDFDLERMIDTREFNAVKIFLSDATVCELRDGTLNEIKAYLKLRISLASAIGSIGKQQMLEREAANFFGTLQECRKAFGAAPKIRALLENFTDSGVELLFIQQQKSNGTSSSQQQQQQSHLLLPIIQLPVMVLDAAMTMFAAMGTVPNKQNSADQQQQKGADRQRQKMDEIAKPFAALLSDYVAHFDAQQQIGTTMTTLKQRVITVRHLAKLLEMVSFALIGAKRLERLFPLLSSVTNNVGSNDVDGNGKSGRNDNKKQLRRRTTTNLDTLGPFSRAIYQALHSLRAFSTTMHKQQSVEMSSTANMGEETDDDQFGFRKMFPTHLLAEFVNVERSVREHITLTSTELFDEIVKSIDDLICFSCH